MFDDIKPWPWHSRIGVQRHGPQDKGKGYYYFFSLSCGPCRGTPITKCHSRGFTLFQTGDSSWRWAKLESPVWNTRNSQFYVSGKRPMATMVMVIICFGKNYPRYRCFHHILRALLWFTVRSGIAFDINLQRNTITSLWRLNVTRNICLCGHQGIVRWYIYIYIYIYTWWRRQMETFSALLAFVLGIHRLPVNSPHKGQWREAEVRCFFDQRPNTRLSEQSIRRWFETHRAHYDVTVM